MTKLDEAVEAAIAAYENAMLLPQDYILSDDAMKAAGQAFLKVLLPEERIKRKGEDDYDLGHRLGYGFCRQQIQINARIR